MALPQVGDNSAAMSDKPPRKTTAELLREALAARKAAGPANKRPLRPETGGGKVSKDAERLAGKSRKVH